jgi:RNA polymerase sigma factor (sigma-70 family)
LRRLTFRSPALASFAQPSSQGDQPVVVFDELALPLLDSLHNFAHWLAKDQSDADDLVQETYLKALRSYASFEPGTHFRPWIFRILRNTFISSQSRIERRLTVAAESEEDYPGIAATPEELLMRLSDIDTVRRAIDQLPIIFREVILLFYVEDASYREIAETLSIPIGTVMSRTARARLMIRESLRSTATQSA